VSDTSWAAAAVAGITAAYALGSRASARSPVSSAIVFVGFGVLLGPVGLDLVSLEHDGGPLLSLLEAALTLVLFTDAMAVPVTEMRAGGALPGRLLGIGLALSIAAGWLLAWPLLPGLSAWELALVGAILAPTDAALSASAMSNPGVPRLVRQTLNVESGLNDGMVLPFFVLFLAAIPGTSYAEEGAGGTVWRALLLSTAFGLAVGWIGGRALCLSYRRGWITREWGQVYFLALAAGSYALAVATKGSGFIAAWVAGAVLAAALRRDDPTLPQDARTAELAEYLGSLLAMISLLVFGAVLLGPALEHLSWRIVGYALLSLTVVRMIPVTLALTGSGLKPPTVAYIAWFGPRGLASIVLGLLVAEEHIAGVQLIGRVVAVTVGLSVLLHGLSAVALADRYARWYRLAAAAPDLRENAATSATARARGIGAPNRRAG
jgi:sodium/hydrogen antiporter